MSIESETPPEPPEWLLDELILSQVRGVGPKLRQNLLERFPTATEILNASADELRQVSGIGAKLVLAITTARDMIDARAEWDFCQAHGLEVLSLRDELRYPSTLRQIPDPPGILFVRGEVLPEDGLAVAIVGSRHATNYGLAQSERLAASLARAGFTIVSGLARGIDAAAHRGALSAGGRTIAVLGGGLAKIYPPEHRGLADEIAAHGALISEEPPRVEPRGDLFPKRNRLISGLTQGVIVVEAALRSGASITARHAMEQGRDVFAVPGRVDSRLSRGCHRLLRDGAVLVESADDVIQELGPLAVPTPDAEGNVVRHPAEVRLNDLERQILSAIDTQGVSIDQVIYKSNKPTHQVLATISVLETRRLVGRSGGQMVFRR